MSSRRLARRASRVGGGLMRRTLSPLSLAATSRVAEVDCRVGLVSVGTIQAVDVRQDAVPLIARERPHIENGRADGKSQAVGGDGIGLESGKFPLQAGTAVTEGTEHLEDGTTVGIESPPRQSAADRFGKVGRLDHHGLALDIAYLADEQGGGAEPGLLAEQECGGGDVLEGDRPAAGRGRRTGCRVEHRGEIPGSGRLPSLLPREGAAASLALDAAFGLETR